MKAIIAGGGIGGLVTALCLHDAGIECCVYESVETIKPLGVGINLLPHAMRVLTELGLEPLIEESAVATSALVYANKFGQVYWSEARGKFAGYKWSQFSIHRGKLQMLLFDEVSKRLGKDKLLTGHHLENFATENDQVKASFSTAYGEVEVMGDLLIAADGIHSRVRHLLFPSEGEVIYSGNILYRGTSLMKPFLNGSSMVMIGHNRHKMVVYPIAKPGEDGLQLINWVGNLKEENLQLKARDWNRKADKNMLLEKYKGWNFDWLDVEEMIGRSEAIYEFPMSDRDPLPAWSFGKVTLLGDAAHPMYPIGSNGASQAILDAAFLATCLTENSSVETALKNYENERLTATSKVVLQNRKKGPDSIMDLMEERFPNGFEEHEIPVEDLSNIMDHYRQLAGFDKVSLNAR
ncbi:MAG: flavin-dependent oxidoreductase [Saprospiraceae bacterium]|nr:flavin-dependent oxidoreductase [Saprospiraceae bacterium]